MARKIRPPLAKNHSASASLAEGLILLATTMAENPQTALPSVKSVGRMAILFTTDPPSRDEDGHSSSCLHDSRRRIAVPPCRDSLLPAFCMRASEANACRLLLP